MGETMSVTFTFYDILTLASLEKCSKLIFDRNVKWNLVCECLTTFQIETLCKALQA